VRFFLLFRDFTMTKHFPSNCNDAEERPMYDFPEIYNHIAHDFFSKSQSIFVICYT
jgi:hypothetical protein